MFLMVKQEDVWPGQKDISLHTEEKVTKKQKLNPSLPKQINTSRGPEQDVLIAQKDNEIEEL